MEKVFTNKSIWKKIVVVILVIMAFQVFVSVPIVRADEEKSDAAQEGDNILWKGILVRPLLSFVVSLADGIVNLLHSQIMGQESTLQKIVMGDEPGWFLPIIGGIVTAIIIVAGIALAMTGVGAIVEAIAGVALASISATAVMVITGIGLAGGALVAFAIHENMMPDTLYLPTYTYSAEEIFKGNILLFNVNFFDAESKEIFVNYSWEEKKETTQDMGTTSGGAQITSTTSEIVKKSDSCSLDTYENEVLKGDGGPYSINYYYYIAKDINGNDTEVKTSSQDSGRFLRGTISSWYVAIRNICIVGMLSMLIYVAIRMMLTTIASDKAKYKEMLKDWLVGLCLLFVVHYIMAFSIVIVEKITEVVKTSIDKNLYVAVIADKNGKLSEAVKGTDLSETIKDGYMYYPVNLMGFLRLQIQKLDIDETGAYLGYAICFIMLITFTIIFTFIYLKRLLYMAFLTIIAPVVALTYSLDKLKDGQAQGFNMWLKEYIFNLLIQPMHLLLYFILVSSAIELAGKNVIYSIVALGFMIPAEKLLRRMFGFENAKTPPSMMGATVGGQMFMNAMNRLKGIGPHGERRGDENKNQLEGESGIKTPENLGGDVNPTEAISKGILNDGNHNSTANDRLSTANDRLTEPMSKLSAGDDRGENIRQTDNQAIEDGEGMWQNEEIAQRMGELDREEQDLREMAYMDVRDPESFEAWQDLRSELDNKRKDVLLDDYKIRMAKIHNPDEENKRDNARISNAENTQDMQEPSKSGRLTTPNNSAVARARQNNRVSGGKKKVNTNMDRFKRLGRYTKQRVKGKAIRGAKSLGRFAAKTGMQIPLAATGMMLGGAVTAATTGDFGKTAQAMTTGGDVGATIGSRLFSASENNAERRIEFIQGAQDAWFGEDPDRIQRQQNTEVRRRMKDDRLRNKISSQIGEKGLEDMVKSGDLEKYIRNGVEKPEEMVALHKLQEAEGISTEAAIGTHRLHKEMAGGKNTTMMTGKKKVVEAIHDKYLKETTNGDEKQATNLTNVTMGYMDTYSNFLYQ